MSMNCEILRIVLDDDTASKVSAKPTDESQFNSVGRASAVLAIPEYGLVELMLLIAVAAVAASVCEGFERQAFSMSSAAALFVVGLAAQDAVRAIDLLGQQQQGQFVREGQARQAEA